jgi:hypothetical protein
MVYFLNSEKAIAEEIWSIIPMQVFSPLQLSLRVQISAAKVLHL